ncbi:cell division protein FtsW [Gordonia spumicola]|uniref:Probable peptidoglycan glycosyltransferase FtsW n=1 Tax=Gordonia spumicola TaxID=589161 RepID=A0A7I9VDA1_9ACTN|nr:putative lipid II flippase FtsW [Gordonia spumicola]GEE03336.1 cell division protein FtsW [Gordonia spumicola]
MRDAAEPDEPDVDEQATDDETADAEASADASNADEDTGDDARDAAVPDEAVRAEPGRGLNMSLSTVDVRAVLGTARQGVANLLGRPLTSFHIVLSLTVILTVLGLLMVLSASSVDGFAKDGSAYGMFTTQAMFVALGFVCFYMAMRMTPALLQRLSFPLLLVSVFLLIMVMIPGVGVQGGGAKRWIEIGGLTLQPSEVAKVALCLWGASILAHKRPGGTLSRELLLPLLPVAGAVAFLVAIQPNQSTMMILVMIVGTLLIFAGLPGRFVVSFGAIFAVGAVAFALIEDYRAARVFSFLGGSQDVQGSGYQANQAKYALADGGIFGKGLGQGTAKWNYLPNAHNDFIFAIIGEELGLVGALSVVTLYMCLGWVGMRIARRSADPFLRLLSVTITVLFLAQAFINIGYVIGLLPVTGIQLPILSYGGTSALTMLTMLGLLANAARHEPAAVAALTAPKPKGLARLLRLPIPQAYKPPRRPSDRARRDPRRAASTSDRRRPAPVRSARVPRAGRGRGSTPSSSGEIHYPVRQPGTFRREQPRMPRTAAARAERTRQTGAQAPRSRSARRNEGETRRR